MSVRLEDALGASGTVTHPYDYAVQSIFWRQWDIDLAEFSDAGVNLTTVAKLTIGLGGGIHLGQTDEDQDTLYIDHVRLCRSKREAT